MKQTTFRASIRGNATDQWSGKPLKSSNEALAVTPFIWFGMIDCFDLEIDGQRTSVTYRLQKLGIAHHHRYFATRFTVETANNTPIVSWLNLSAQYRLDDSEDVFTRNS